MNARTEDDDVGAARERAHRETWHGDLKLNVIWGAYLPAAVILLLLGANGVGTYWVVQFLPLTAPLLFLFAFSFYAWPIFGLGVWIRTVVVQPRSWARWCLTPAAGLLGVLFSMAVGWLAPEMNIR